ncbi:helix-turn-helix domain-containing protein [Endomicrobium proavitum]|uniref:Cytoskeleton protein RodZ-like C-terminal domain-containing protein n=1 Tax=Endomicrobium proavitum TaxID=1408281 RepID=A0A0G3WJC3_9BACT|nr:helix-turn-helix domain-containing protein [Endomicrobium proavitum]AKL97955.1 hypothetical protein Epro_0576 [Endomicrobium proavitum]
MKELGKLLKEKRLSKGLTFDAVHKAVKIQEKYLQAIEDGDDTVFVAEVYYKSFVRSYAKFLGFDADALLKEHNLTKIPPLDSLQQQPIQELSKNTPEKNAAKQDAQNTPERKKTDIKKPVAALLVAAVLLGAFMYLNKKISSSSAFSAAAVVKIEEKAEPQNVITPPDVLRQKVVLEAVDTVWVKVDGDGKEIFEGTLIKGARQELFADDSFVLRIGYTPGVRVFFNGQEIDVKTGSIQDVKTVVLKKRVGSK